MNLAIIGGGSWGTALSIILAPKFDRIGLWVHEPSLSEEMQRTRENSAYLPGFRLAPNIEPTTDFAVALQAASIVMNVVPSHHLRGVVEQILAHLKPSMAYVSATKGIELQSLLRMSEVVEQIISRRFSAPPVAVLSGPTFAREVAAGDPTAVVVAGKDPGLTRRIQKAFSGPTFRLYTNDDPVGVELGAALKNVIAIAAGICQGLNLGSNAVAALVTRGLVEISRLAESLGGNPRTLSGLAGLGDLVLTCTGDLSRNRRVGIALGQGHKLVAILADMKMVAEGVQTSYAAHELARRQGVSTPIVDQMCLILREGKPPRDGIRHLMERELRSE